MSHMVSGTWEEPSKCQLSPWGRKTAQTAALRWAAGSTDARQSGPCSCSALLRLALCVTFLRFCFSICKMTIMTFSPDITVKIKLDNKVLITVPGPQDLQLYLLHYGLGIAGVGFLDLQIAKILLLRGGVKHPFKGTGANATSRHFD